MNATVNETVLIDIMPAASTVCKRVYEGARLRWRQHIKQDGAMSLFTEQLSKAGATALSAA